MVKVFLLCFLNEIAHLWLLICAVLLMLYVPSAIMAAGIAMISLIIMPVVTMQLEVTSQLLHPRTAAFSHNIAWSVMTIGVVTAVILMMLLPIQHERLSLVYVFGIIYTLANILRLIDYRQRTRTL